MDNPTGARVGTLDRPGAGWGGEARTISVQIVFFLGQSSVTWHIFLPFLIHSLCNLFSPGSIVHLFLFTPPPLRDHMVGPLRVCWQPCTVALTIIAIADYDYNYCDCTDSTSTLLHQDLFTIALWFQEDGSAIDHFWITPQFPRTIT